VRSGNARPAHMVVRQELAGRGRVVGPPALECAIVVAIFGNRVVVDDRPVGRVDEQRLGVISQVRGRRQRGGQPSVGVGKAASVALLDGVAAAERRLSAVVRLLPRLSGCLRQGVEILPGWLGRGSERR
jgi:hypothetical protein